jgi:hypothetical protein
MMNVGPERSDEVVDVLAIRHAQVRRYAGSSRHDVILTVSARHLPRSYRGRVSFQDKA